MEPNQDGQPGEANASAPNLGGQPPQVPQDAPVGAPIAGAASGALPGTPGSGDSPEATGFGGLQLASFGDRALGWLVDLAIIIAALIPVFILGAIVGAVSSILGTLVTMVGYLFVWGAAVYVMGWLPGLTGQSPGKRVIGTRVVGAKDGQLLGGPKHLGRLFAGGFLHSILCGIPIGWLWPLFDKERQTWADKILSSHVVKTEKSGILPIFPDGKPF